MYKVYLNDTLIYDLSQEIVLIDPVVKLEESKSGSFDFSIEPENPGYLMIKKLTSIVTVVKVENDTEVEVFKGRVLEEEKDFYNIKQVSCEGELAYLLDSVQRPAEFHNISVRSFLQTLIDSHNAQMGNNNEKKFVVGMVTVTDPNDSLHQYTNWENTLAEIKDKLVDLLGGRIRIRNQSGIRYLDYIAEYDNTNTQVIEFGENLLDYSENTTAADIATCVIPLGARLEESSIEELEEYTTIVSVNGGKDNIYIPEAVQKYGWVVRTVNFNDVHVPANLKQKGEEWLRDNQYETMTLNLTAVDLNLYDVDYERVKLGDRIRVKSKPHGMDRYFPVTNMEIYLDSPEKNTVVLGKSEKNFTARSTETASGIYRALEQIPSGSVILKQAIDNATALITAKTTGHVVTSGNELLIMDTDNKETAAKVWRWNLNGLGYSGSGYNGSYATAMTMDGTIVGNFIAANSIAAEKLSLSYRTEVEKQIQLAEMNANQTTDDKLTQYWTKVQVETSIKNTKDSILITAKEEAIGYVDNKLTGYYSKAQIDVKTDSITQSVTKEITDRKNDVTSLSARITTNANSINLKVSKGSIASELSVESGRVTISGNRLVVNATNFSLTASGTATMKNATVTGVVRNENGSYWTRLQTARLEGGVGSTTYGILDFAGGYSNSSSHVLRIRGYSDINLMGKLYTSTGPNASTVYAGKTGQMGVVYRIQQNSNGTLTWYTATYSFTNGVLTSGTLYT